MTKLTLASEEVQQVISDYNMMTNTPQSTLHNETMYRIRRATKWASKKVYILTAYATQEESVEFTTFAIPQGAKKLSKTTYENEAQNRRRYQKGLNSSLNNHLANKVTASFATD